MNSQNFKQYDTRWASLGYPKKPYYIKGCGCGEVAVANCIIEMEQYKNETPKTIQPYCKQYAAPNGNGTYFSGIPAMMKHYGMTEVKEHDTMPQLFKELAKGGRVAILLMGSKLAGSKKVRWTSSAHFVACVGYKKSGSKDMLYIKDSNSTSSLRNGWLSYQEHIKGDCLRVWSGKLNSKAAEKPVATKTVDEIAKEVIDGKWGNGDDRVARLKAAGYDSVAVQNKVNELLAPKKTAQQKAIEWARKIAADNSWHYVKWVQKVKATQECPICKKHSKSGSYYGGNCIWFAWASWRHGAGISCRCSCGVFSNAMYEKILSMSAAEALKNAKERLGISTVKVLKNKNGLAMSSLQPGDIIVYFNGSKYIHTALYVGNGLIADCTSGRNPAIKYGVKSYTKWKIKIAFRYTGK